jgi:anti-sigma factor RsiW
MTHVHEDLGAYVLGSLSADEAERVRAHLAACETCSIEHAELAGLPGLLDLAVIAGSGEDDPLPPAIEERLLDRFARERPAAKPRRSWRPRIFLGAGSAFAGAAVAVCALLFGFGFAKPAARPVSYRLALAPVPGAPANASARAALRTVKGGTVVRLWVYNLPANADGSVYEVLCSSKSWSASAGTFRVDGKGNAYAILTTAAKRGQYDTIQVVRKTDGGEKPVVSAKLA